MLSQVGLLHRGFRLSNAYLKVHVKVFFDLDPPIAHILFDNVLEDPVSQLVCNFSTLRECHCGVGFELVNGQAWH